MRRYKNLFFPFFLLSIFVRFDLYGDFKPVSSSILELFFKPFALPMEHSQAKNIKIPIKKIKKYCQDIEERFKHYRWKTSHCQDVSWKVYGELTTGNHPLVYAVFGHGSETTLILSGVHPDEITPNSMGFWFAYYLLQHPEIYQKHDVRVVIAPLVNPDGFFASPPTRTNNRGVDLNRNFMTYDWYKNAWKNWIYYKKRHPNYFPGLLAESEIETVFQTFLIKNFKPHKAISVHAPLGFYDYDGPGDRQTKGLSLSMFKSKQLIKKMSKKSNNYRVVDYSFYPGSFGNYMGNERKTPTVTLELATTDPRKAKIYWQKFLPSLISAVHHPVKAYLTSVKRKTPL